MLNPSIGASTFEYLSATYGATMTLKQFALETHRSESNLRKKMSEGEIPGIQIGTRWVIATTKAAKIIDGNEGAFV
ncbi:MAG: hypothetical protein IJ111_06200 [Eggerthellaceae bacterium]|nr:hypothetical protein [Eggerthellaceae bacterium]